MKIVMITKDFIPLKGGAERYSSNLANTLADMGHEVHILSRYCGITNPNIHPHLLPENSFGFLSQPVRFIKNVHNILSKMNGIKDAIIYSIAPYYPANVYRAGDGVYEYWGRFKYPNPIHRLAWKFFSGKWIHCSIEREIYTKEQNCQFIITNSDFIKRQIEKHYPAACNRIQVVHNGVNQKFFSPEGKENRSKWLRKFGLDPQKFIILFVGNNWVRKGLKPLLLGAYPLLQKMDASLVVVGKGNQSRLQGFLKKLHILDKVFFAGPSEDVVPWYCAADVFALPTMYDAFANVCLEAMACGTPVITSSENGSAEIIQNGINGFVVSSYNRYDEIQKYLEQIVQEDTRKKLAENALQTARIFTVEKNAQETLDVLKKVQK